MGKLNVIFLLIQSICLSQLKCLSTIIAVLESELIGNYVDPD